MILLFILTSEEEDAFAYLYSHYKGLMLQKAHAILHDRMLAEDAVSEAFLRIYRNRHKLDDPASNRSLSFVMTIVRNTALTIYSRERRQPVSLPDEEEERDSFDLEGYVLSEISSEKILALIGGLPEELRSVFLLKYAHDMPYKQIAQLLGIRENTAAVRLHRAKKQLMAALIKEGYAVETEP